MKLLAFSLRLRAGDGENFAVHGLPFLGGMLHGAWEDQIYRHAPTLTTVLGLENGGAGKPVAAKRYAMLPPPWAQPLPKLDDGCAHLGFGVVLYGTAAAHAGELGSAFCRCPALRLGPLSDRIEHSEFSEHEAAHPASFAALPGITLHWLTPLLLDSAGQRTVGAELAAPTLLRVVRSVARRIRELEPQLAGELSNQPSLDGSDWVSAEESIRTLPAHSTDWQKVNWRYGSRTKAAPVQFSGHRGSIAYRGPIPASIHALLQWGTWFGAGQRTALGQGFYRIEANV